MLVFEIGFVFIEFGKVGFEVGIDCDFIYIFVEKVGNVFFDSVDGGFVVLFDVVVSVEVKRFVIGSGVEGG